MKKSGFTTVDVYNFILQWAVEHQGNTPTQRQVAEGCNVASGTAYHHTQVLIKQGLLERKDGALCVVRAKFSLRADASYPINGSAPPSVPEMTLIPKNIQGITINKLSALGIEVGKPYDDSFRHATYPSRWHYEKIEGDELAYLLVDESEKYVALYHENEGKPIFTYMADK